MDSVCTQPCLDQLVVASSSAPYESLLTMARGIPLNLMDIYLNKLTLVNVRSLWRGVFSRPGMQGSPAVVKAACCLFSKDSQP